MLLPVLFLAAASTGFAAEKPNFTGHWVLNVDKSSFGKLKKPVSVTLDSKQDGNMLQSQTTTNDEQGHRTVEGQWFLDGKEHPVQIGGTGKQKTYWQGNTLVNVQRSDDGKFEQTVRLSLSADGKTCTQKFSSKDPNGNTSGTWIWEKK